jgi:hypothetical protein
MFRSSSLNQYVDFCEQQYYINYVLGHDSPPNLKADMGSITHLALEWLSLLKLEYDRGEKLLKLKTGAIDVEFERDKLYEITTLSDEDVKKINKSRINKQFFLPSSQIEFGQERYGSFVVNTLINAAYKHFSEKISPQHPWTRATYKTCWNWTWMALEQYNRMYDPRFSKIISPEQRFEFEIKEDWAKYEYFLKGKKLEGYLKLKGTIDLVTEVDENTIEIRDWKGLALNTPIPTIKGWKTMADLKVGDIIFDKDGVQTAVIGKSQVKKRPCYKITFDDKSSVVCDDEHLWLLKNGNISDTINLKLKDQIETAKPLRYSKKELPIDPYVLGLWLGDGRNRNAEICGSDLFVFEEIKRRGYKIGKNISTNENCNAHTVFHMTNRLRQLNLLKNKHIPEIYLESSFQQRLDLLRGLMDSDGNVNSVRKQAIFTNCNKRLSDDVIKLLLSLGQKPLQSHVKSKGFGLVVDNYPISFKPIDINPFLLPRKANKILKEWGYGKSNFRWIKNIELIGEGETQCIKVDSPSSTYLCTENMIPTHNTGKMFNWGKNEPKSYETLQKDKQLMFYYYAAKHIFPQYENIMITIIFVRDGGPVTVCFDDSDYQEVENMIKEAFLSVKNNQEPKLLDPSYRDHRCNKFCAFYKKQVDGKPLCAYIKDSLDEYGMDHTTDTEIVKGFSPGYYENPGE